MVSVIVRFVKDTFLHLYDHTIKPILTYGSEIWGMFSVDSSRCWKNIAVMSELGRYPIYFSVILAMLKYCHRLEGQQVYYLMLIYVIKSYILVKSIHSIRIYYE
jgi:hypothetical protein